MQQIKVKWVLWSWREQPFLTLAVLRCCQEGFMRRWHQSGSGKVILAVSVGVRKVTSRRGNRMSKEKSGLGVLKFRLM